MATTDSMIILDLPRNRDLRRESSRFEMMRIFFMAYKKSTSLLQKFYLISDLGRIRCIVHERHIYIFKSRLSY